MECIEGDTAGEGVRLEGEEPEIDFFSGGGEEIDLGEVSTRLEEGCISCFDCCGF